MEKTIYIENTGITNSTRAIDNNTISVSKLLEVAGFVNTRSLGMKGTYIKVLDYGSLQEISKF